MKKAYIITVKEKDVSFYFSYFENGFIESFNYSSPYDPPEKAQRTMMRFFPFHISQIQAYKDAKNIFRVREIIPDLSFKKFWNSYGYKQGKKARAERLWKQLSDVEKAKALAYIRTYDNFLFMNKGIAKAYPETYLSQKRWENEE